jgi:hypothetical protein
MIVLIVLLIVFLWVGVKIRRIFRKARGKVTGRPAAS